MPELDADFIISNNNQLEAEYEINEGQHFDCSFEIFAAGATWNSIAGDPYDNEALSDVLNQKADTSTVETLSETVTNNYNTLDNKIDTHIADKGNPHEVSKVQVGLGNVDNTSDLNKPISTATQTALNGKQNTISDLSTIRTNASNGQSAYNTIQTFGDVVTHNVADFATAEQGELADTAIQPNDDISELNNDVGYITDASLPTVNNPTIIIQRNNVTAGDFNLNQSNNETINIDVPTTASDVNALPDTTTIEDLTTTTQLNAINSGATTSNIGQIATNTSNISSLSTTVTNNYNTLDGRITSEVTTLNTSIGAETTNRQNADNNLQSQIDAIVSSSDVFDIVGTYAELQAYDISTVPVNDIIKVLVDSTHNNAAAYYRCVESSNVKSWLYIGAEGAYYTKSESDSLFVEQTTTVNNKPLSNNITLTASDIGALPSSTTIGNGILTIQKNGANVDTFDANATSNKTINIITPTKTSDLTNDSGFISGITSSDVNNALGYTPYNSANPAGYTNNIGTITDVKVNNTSVVSGSVADIDLDTSKLSYYGTCSTSATAQAKAVVCPDFVLETGVSIRVRFTSAQTYNGQPTLNVNSTGAKNITFRGATAGIRYMWQAGSIIEFTYDGTSWVWGLGGVATTSYYGVTKLSTGAVSTSTSYALTPASLNNLVFNMIEPYPIYSTTATYEVGDKVRNLYNAWECNTPISEPEAWTEEHWTMLSPIQTQIDNIENAGYLTEITSSDVTTALGYTPYNSTNPSGYTSNVGTVTSVNNTQPDVNGNVTLAIPTVNDSTITITQGGVTKGSFTLNQSGGDTIALDASGGTVDQTFNPASANAQSGVAILGLIETIYPIGGIYATTNYNNGVCPLASLFTSTWTLLSSTIITDVGSGSSTSSSEVVSVRGNGKSLGLYDGENSVGLVGLSSTVTRIAPGTNAYNKTSGSAYVSGGTAKYNTCLGVKTNGEAGLTGSVTIPSITITPSKTSITVYLYQRTA